MSFKISTYIILKDKFKSLVETSSLLSPNFNSNCMEKQNDLIETQLEIIKDIFDFLDASSDYSDYDKATIITGALITTKRRSDIKSYKSFIKGIDSVLGVDDNNKLKKSEEFAFRNVYRKYKENNKLYKLPDTYFEFLPLTELEKRFQDIQQEELKQYQVNKLEELPAMLLQHYQFMQSVFDSVKKRPLIHRYNENAKQTIYDQTHDEKLINHFHPNQIITGAWLYLLSYFEMEKSLDDVSSVNSDNSIENIDLNLIPQDPVIYKKLYYVIGVRGARHKYKICENVYSKLNLEQLDQSFIAYYDKALTHLENSDQQLQSAIKYGQMIVQRVQSGITLDEIELCLAAIQQVEAFNSHAQAAKKLFEEVCELLHEPANELDHAAKAIALFQYRAFVQLMTELRRNNKNNYSSPDTSNLDLQHLRKIEQIYRQSKLVGKVLEDHFILYDEQVKIKYREQQVETILNEISQNKKIIEQNKKFKVRNKIIEKLQELNFYEESIIVKKNKSTEDLINFFHKKSQQQYQQNILKNVNGYHFCNSSVFSARITSSSLEQRVDQNKVTKPGP